MRQLCCVREYVGSDLQPNYKLGAKMSSANYVLLSFIIIPKGEIP